MQTGEILQISSFAWAFYLLWKERLLSTKVFSCFEELQTIKQLEGKRLECESTSFDTQVMHQSRLLASGEETTDLDKVVFLLAAHLVNEAAGGERF
jgi:hypothetical protein